MTSSNTSRFVYVTYIRTTPEKLWAALIEPEFTRQYWAGTHQVSDWKVGADWKIMIPDGRVGDSDVAGDLSVLTGGERPFLKAAIVSRRLDFDDLGSLVGAAPATGRGETANAGQKVEGAQRAAGGLLLPTATLQVDRIRAMDAEVTYRAATVNAPNLPLRKVSVDLTLKQGVLNLDPISLTFSIHRGTG